jgi:predicted anti-sigma-YlaC factor YlaD
VESRADVPIHDKMVCQELVELVTSYLDEALSLEDRHRFEEHLEECGYCRRYMEQFQITLRTVAALENETIPPVTQQALVQQFRAWKQHKD